MVSAEDAAAAEGDCGTETTAAPETTQEEVWAPEGGD